MNGKKGFSYSPYKSVVFDLLIILKGFAQDIGKFGVMDNIEEKQIIGSTCTLYCIE